MDAGSRASSKTTPERVSVTAGNRANQLALTVVWAGAHRYHQAAASTWPTCSLSSPYSSTTRTTRRRSRPSPPPLVRHHPTCGRAGSPRRASSSHRAAGPDAVVQLLDVELATTDDAQRRADLLLEKGMVLDGELCDVPGAHAAFATVLELRKNDAMALEALEELNLAEDNWQKFAAKYLQEASASTDRSLATGLYVSAAEAYVRFVPDAPEAEQYLRKALEIEPRNGKAAFHLARLLRARRALAGSRRAARRARREGADHRGARRRADHALGAREGAARQRRAVRARDAARARARSGAPARAPLRHRRRRGRGGLAGRGRRVPGGAQGPPGRRGSRHPASRSR